MSTVIIEKVATAIRCPCGHLWLSTSKSRYPTCPVCHSTISRKKHAVILESDTTRAKKGNENEKDADSGSQVQNAASRKDLIDNGLYNNDKHKLSQESGQVQDQNYNPNPKLQSACSQCRGYIKNCDNCGEKIEILNHRPLNYHEGSLHRCGRGRK